MRSGLLGVELGRSKVRLALLDPTGVRVEDAVEQSMAKPGGPRDPIAGEYSAQAAIDTALDRLGLDLRSDLPVAVTIGFANCGVGSGPALREWLLALSDEIGEPMLFSDGVGVSYAPESCIDFVRRAFGPIGLNLQRVELAPVAAARVLGLGSSAAVTLGSGMAWSARILNGDVLEAFETADGSIDEALRIVVNGVGSPVDQFAGITVDEATCRVRGVSQDQLVVAVGAARGLLENSGTNLLESGLLGAGLDTQPAAVRAPAVETSHVVEGARSGGTEARGEVEGHWSGARWVGDEVPMPPTDPGDVGLDFDDLRDRSYDESHERKFDDTYKLRRLPGKVEHSRELPHRPARSGPVGEAAPRRDAHFDGIEAFAHPDDGDQGFNVSDFVLGALGMLAIVLLAMLVLL